MATETETKPVRYISRYAQLRIVRKPGYSKEVDGQRVSTPGTSIQFEQGVFETTDPEEIAFIEGRKEFGQHIQRVPDNIEDLAGDRAEKFASLEEKEAALKAKEEELEAREKALTAGEAGRAEGDGVKNEDGDGLDDMKRDQLVEEAKKLELPEDSYKVGTKNADIVAAIRAKRADTPAFNE